MAKKAAELCDVCKKASRDRYSFPFGKSCRCEGEFLNAIARWKKDHPIQAFPWEPAPTKAQQLQSRLGF
jgi:hypothetical protein